MDISKLPLHKKTTIVAEKYIIAAVNRFSEDEPIISYINLKTHDEVLRILQKTDGSQIPQYLEEGFWDVYADGRLISNYDFSLFQDLEVKVEISTREKSLSIVSFGQKMTQSKQSEPITKILNGYTFQFITDSAFKTKLPSGRCCEQSF